MRTGNGVRVYTYEIVTVTVSALATKALAINSCVGRGGAIVIGIETAGEEIHAAQSQESP